MLVPGELTSWLTNLLCKLVHLGGEVHTSKKTWLVRRCAGQVIARRRVCLPCYMHLCPWCIAHYRECTPDFLRSATLSRGAGWLSRPGHERMQAHSDHRFLRMSIKVIPKIWGLVSASVLLWRPRQSRRVLPEYDLRVVEDRMACHASLCLSTRLVIFLIRNSNQWLIDYIYINANTTYIYTMN